MQGSLYPDGVLVNQVALRRTELTKAAEILRDRTSMSSRGLLSGGEVTLNGVDSSRIDIAAFSGFVPSGEFVSRSSSALNITLSDYTTGTVNLVCVVYTEDNTHNQPHESDEQVYPTFAESAYRVRVYTQAEYDALPPTDDNLSNDARDRIMILAQATATGAGSPPTLTGPLTFQNIQYTVPSVLATIAGVQVLAVSSGTPQGQGVIEFDDTTVSPNYQFRWQPYGLSSAGPWVEVTGDTEVNLPDTNGDYITIQVVTSQLPNIGGTVTENVIVYNLYNQNIPRFSAADYLHRNKIGTGVVSAQNPHGNSLNDFAGEGFGLLEEHQDVMHSKGIWRGSSATIFAVSINTVADPLGDLVTVNQPLTSDLYYINGKKLNTMAPTSFLFNDTGFSSGDVGATNRLGTKLFELYVDDDATLISHLRAYFPDTRNCTGVWVIDCHDEFPGGAYSLKYNVSSGVYTFSLNDGAGVVYSPSVTTNLGVVLRLYDASGVYWIDLWVNLNEAVPANADGILQTVDGDYVDTVTFVDAPDLDQHMKIHAMAYWYDAAAGPAKGKIGYPPYVSTLPRTTLDKRQYGNLNTANIDDETLEKQEYQAIDTYHRSGILNGYDDGNEFRVSGTSGTTRTFSGGSYYCRGKLLSTTGVDYDFTTASSYLVYADYRGNFQNLDIGAGSVYNNDLTEALKFVVGNGMYRDPVTDSTYALGKDDHAERGVPLYLVVSNGVSVITWDISRNVNHEALAWSVGTRASCNADFAGLQGAQAWTDLYQELGLAKSITLTVIGDVSIHDAAYVQAEGIRVTGGAKSGTVYVDYGATTGAWVLGDNAVVDNVNIQQRVNGNCFRMASGMVVRDCSYTYAAGTVTNDHVFTENATSYLEVEIKGNNIITINGLFDQSAADTGHIDVDIKDNIIVQGAVNTDGAAFPGVVALSGTQLTIENNTITTLNTGGVYTFGIVGLSWQDCHVRGNTIYLGAGDGTSSEVGIYGFLTESEIAENTILRLAGSTATTGVGVALVGESGSYSSSVRDNVFRGMGIGISMGAFFGGGTIRNFSVSGNKFYNTFYRAVSLYSESQMTNIKIHANQIFSVYRSGGLGSWTGAAGICVELNGNTNLSGLSITDNVIRADGSAPNNSFGYGVFSATGDVHGILVDISGVTNTAALSDGITINDNQIINAQGGIAANTKYIKVAYDGAGQIYNLSINGNNLAGVTLTTTGEHDGIEFVAPGLSSDNHRVLNACSNEITIVDVFGNLQSNGIVFGGVYQEFVVADNKVRCSRTGVSVLGHRGNISGNTVESNSVGIEVNISDSMTVVNNEILINTLNPHESSHYRNGCIGIGFLFSTDFICRGNSVKLRGWGGTAMLEDSVNILVGSACNSFTMDANRTFQEYTGTIAHYFDGTGGKPDVTDEGQQAAFHVYMNEPGVGSAKASIDWSFTNNVLDNYNNVPGPSRSHGLYVTRTGSYITDKQMRIQLSSNQILGSNWADRYEFFWNGNYLTDTASFATHQLIVTGNHLALLYFPASDGTYSTKRNLSAAFDPAVATNIYDEITVSGGGTAALCANQDF